MKPKWNDQLWYLHFLKKMHLIVPTAAVASFPDILSKRFHSLIISVFCIIDTGMQLRSTLNSHNRFGTAVFTQNVFNHLNGC